MPTPISVSCDDETMLLKIEDLRDALDSIGGSAGVEAEIAAQLVLDLAIAARYAGRRFTPKEAQWLLRQRLAHRCVAQQPASSTIH